MSTPTTEQLDEEYERMRDARAARDQAFFASIDAQPEGEGNDLADGYDPADIF